MFSAFLAFDFQIVVGNVIYFDIHALVFELMSK